MLTPVVQVRSPVAASHLQAALLLQSELLQLLLQVSLSSVQPEVVCLP